VPYRFNDNRRYSEIFGAGLPALGAVKPATFSEALLNAIPGGLAWISLLLVLYTALFYPFWMFFGASLLSAYTSIRFAFAGLAIVRGLRLVKRWRAIDWRAEYERRVRDDSLPLADVHHVVIIPNYKESLATLRETLQALSAQSVDGGSISVVLAMEVGEDGAASKGEILKAEFADCFAHIFVTLHPKGLHTEMQCKSSNESWAARWVKRQLVDELGYSLQNLVVTTMDADTLWAETYLEALGVLFATAPLPHRYTTFWQAPIRYHSNVWAINPFMRLLHAYSTAWELAYLSAPWWMPLPMSSYSLSLKLLDTVNYWDADVIADEWHMFIKAFFLRDGEVAVQPIYLPFSASATGGETLWDSLKQRYQQTLRHAWGAKEIGYTIALMQNHPHVNKPKSYHLLFRVAHDNLLAGAGWIIITLGTQLPNLFHPQQVVQWTGTPPFWILQVSFLVVTLLTLFIWRVDVRTRPPRPLTPPPSRAEKLQALLSIPLLPLVTLVCLAIPVLVSQTRLMLGMGLQFRVTRKFFEQI